MEVYLEHGPVEFRDGLCDANRSENGVYFLEPRLWRISVVISEEYHGGEIKGGRRSGMPCR
jgi:hypothetical protein